jgi:hypothetical protein
MRNPFSPCWAEPDHLGVEVLLGMDLVPGRIFTLDGVQGTLTVTRPR